LEEVLFGVLGMLLPTRSILYLDVFVASLFASSRDGEHQDEDYN
jgi:hypothetical protein